MVIKIKKHKFDEPCKNKENLKPQSGVYVVLSRKNAKEKWKIIDVGETDDVKKRMGNHDRKSCWKRKKCGELYYTAHYTDEQERVKIEQKIRDKCYPPCGRKIS